MGRVLEHVPDGAPLHDAAHIHDGHVVGQLAHHAHVVGDEHDGGVVLPLELLHQLEDLGLDGHVQSGGRLVCDEHLGVAAHGHGDHGPLTHTAGELMGVLVDALLRGGDAHLGQ